MKPDTPAAVRGVSVGALAAGVTAAGHAAGGGMPSEAGVLVLVAVCATVGYAARMVPRIGRIGVLVALGIAQAVGHLLLSALDCHHPMVLTDGHMIGAHVVAACFGAWLVRHAESGARRAISTLLRLVPRLVLPVVDRTSVIGRSATQGVSLRVEPVDLSGWGTRGPPAFG